MIRRRQCDWAWPNLVTRAICASLVVFFGIAAAQDVPTAWRRPTPEEVSDVWRDKNPTRFTVVNGDFDGDGKPDSAELLVNSASNQFGLFVRLAATGKWEMISKPLDAMWLPHFGIDLVKPGKYPTACGKTYGLYACAHGEPEELKVPNGAIDLFYREKSESYYYWDKKEKTFRKIVMTD